MFHNNHVGPTITEGVHAFQWKFHFTSFQVHSQCCTIIYTLLGNNQEDLLFRTRTPPISLVNITARGWRAQPSRVFFMKWHAIVMRVQERKAQAVYMPLRPPPRGRTILPPQTRIESQKSLFLRNFLISSSMTGVFWIIIFLHFCTKLSVLLHPFRSISIILSCQDQINGRFKFPLLASHSLLPHKSC